jgi:hypothetical protein
MTYLKKVLEKHIYIIIHCNIVFIFFNFQIEYRFGIFQEQIVIQVDGSSFC